MVGVVGVGVVVVRGRGRDAKSGRMVLTANSIGGRFLFFVFVFFMI